ncbi:hypothetical protein EVAR_48769_1 [Eumeta japonica]|uniref:Uncharacterized protein n=1 Tax=Eumeta variegata TaxID=151549 RepID=A0A4C1Y4I5_EUMVA|nr:hypothetical protein EVAR_48769_1 [Eumeta japonica]
MYEPDKQLLVRLVNRRADENDNNRVKARGPGTALSSRDRRAATRPPGARVELVRPPSAIDLLLSAYLVENVEKLLSYDVFIYNGTETVFICIWSER